MELNKSTIRKILWLITFAIVLHWGLQNHQLVGSLVKWLLWLVNPFILGASIAFILNVPMRLIEAHLFPAAVGPKAARARRLVSLSLASILILGIVVLVVILVIPQLTQSIMTLAERLPEELAVLQAWLTGIVADYPDIRDAIATYSFDLEYFGRIVADFLSKGASSFFSSTFSFAASIVNGIVMAILGIVFAYYLLAKKETFGSQARRLLQAFLPPAWARKILSVAALTSHTFARFITGQCLEAVILGLMFLATMLLFGFPYAMLISVLITFTALIPIVGAFIGCFVGMLLIAIINPVLSIWFLILFLVLQQIEENLIYPRVVGNSVGLPAIWVLVAFTVGGKLYGIIGMLVFIPLCSVLYALLREAVHNRLGEDPQKVADDV